MLKAHVGTVMSSKLDSVLVKKVGKKSKCVQQPGVFSSTFILALLVFKIFRLLGYYNFIFVS